MNKPFFIMMVGLPASGKSYYAEQFRNEYQAEIFSSDEIRKEILQDVNNQDKNGEVFNVLHKRLKEHLSNGGNAIYDATNISYKRRMAFLNELKKIPCKKVCILIATPYKDCLKQNANRERIVPEEVITKMYKNIYIPQYYEGWDDIQIVKNYNAIYYNIDDLFYGINGLMDISQDNSHHTLTVGKHCKKCADNLDDKYVSYVVWKAALLHDIGKPFTKSFINSKGETTEDAHYYQHHLVSAYDSLFYNEYEQLNIANYIQWHMQPFFMTDDEQKNKYKTLWGENFYNNIMLLHEADINAK